MILRQLLEDREKWQSNTIEHIRRKILGEATFSSESKRSEKLVVIYGPPQIGKTTLILFLMGISTEYQKKVYNTLRAGVPRGTSSTSTSIIYHKSDTKEYGIKYGDSKTDIEYCTENCLENKIKEIRSKVENKEADNDIIHIYIFQNIFFKREQKKTQV